MTRSTNVPKRALIQILADSVGEQDLRNRLNIQETTELTRRLEDFTKLDLLGIIEENPELERAFFNVEQNYPFPTSPTLYLIIIQDRPETDDLIQTIDELSRVGIEGALVFGDDRTIRCVYIQSPAQERPGNFLEIPLYYEKKVYLSNPNPEDDDYGERKSQFSLERGLIWIPEDYRYGIIASADFSSIRPIMNFGKEQLEIRCYQPNIPEDMLHRISLGGNPRSATFTTSAPDLAEIDVQTLTISDPILGERLGYTELMEDMSRQQTAGFYLNHPVLPKGGLGISRRYGRVWTPMHLTRGNLLAMANSVVERTRRELAVEFERDHSDYVSFYSNVPVVVNGKKITGKTRRIFNLLIRYILDASRTQGETQVPYEDVYQILESKRELGIIDTLEFECENCGDSMARSMESHNPYEFSSFSQDSLVFSPLGEDNQLSSEDEAFTCECGQPIVFIDLRNHIRILPSPELVAAVSDFVSNMDEVQFEGFFIIEGETLRLVPAARSDGLERVSLEDLHVWRENGRIHLIPAPSEAQHQRVIERLRDIGEKCGRNNGHPSRETCRECLQNPVSIERIYNPRDICLPRILGLAIDMGFDGIHHGHEYADIKYDDFMAEEMHRVHIGVHLKSRVTPQPPNGVGRSLPKIKGLYTQLCYSAYLSKVNRYHFDVLGVSIPNGIREDAQESLQLAANLMGFPILFLDDNDWVKVFRIAEGKLIEEEEFEGML